MKKSYKINSMSACILIITILLTFFSGCAIYHEKPLSMQPTLPQEVPHLTIDAAQMPLHELASHRFDPRDGLDITEVAMLAVVNNPDLKIARDDAGVSRAQAFAAGLLPDPQVTASVDVPSGNISGSNFTAYNLGLNYDVGALLVRSAVKGAAEALSRKTDLSLLWQEWQVVAQARVLFVRNLEQNRLMVVLRENRDLLEHRYQHAQQALKDGNTTLDAVSVDFVALQDITRQTSELERQKNQNRYDLNALLGLAPDVHLQLVGDETLPDIDTKKVVADLSQLAFRRPDLLALKAGYESQDQRLRQSIIAQFPALNVGIARARDTSNVYTLGLGITMNLPIFNRNRGNIAIEQATRQRLYDEFQVRLNNSCSEIERILADQQLLEQQLANARAGLTSMDRLLVNAEAAFRSGNITELAYINLRAGLLNKRIDAITLEQKIQEQRIGLLTLIGSSIPVAKKP